MSGVKSCQHGRIIRKEYESMEIKNKKFFTTKETINKMKRTKIEWEKIFANHTWDKELIPKIHKELIYITQ